MNDQLTLPEKLLASAAYGLTEMTFSSDLLGASTPADFLQPELEHMDEEDARWPDWELAFATSYWLLKKASIERLKAMAVASGIADLVRLCKLEGIEASYELVRNLPVYVGPRRLLDLWERTAPQAAEPSPDDAVQDDRRQPSTNTNREALRSQAIALLAEDPPLSAPAIARRLGVPTNTIYFWRKRWQAGLPLVPAGGSRSRLDDAQKAELLAVLEAGPAAHGYENERWRLQLVVDLVYRLFGVRYSIPGVSHLLQRIGYAIRTSSAPQAPPTAPLLESANPQA